MAGYYGYNPRDYVQDFSWIGDIGSAISAASNKMPELIKFNRLLNENKKAKEIVYTSLNQVIDSFNDDELANIGMSMGLAESGKPTDPNVIKEKLRGRLEKSGQYAPKKGIIGEGIDSKQYANRVINGFAVPLIQAATSKSGGGPMDIYKTMTRIMANVDNTSINKALQESEPFSRGQQLSDYQQQQKIQMETGVEGDKLRTENETQRGAEYSERRGLGDIGPTTVSEAQRAEQLNIQRKRQKFTSKRMNKEKLQEVDPTTLLDLRKDAATIVGRINKEITDLKEKKKKKTIDPVAYEEQLDELNRQLDLAKENQSSIVAAQKFSAATGDKTKTGTASAIEKGQAVADIMLDKPARGNQVGDNTLVEEAKSQFRKTGNISDELRKELQPIAQKRGITVNDLLVGTGIARPSMSTQQTQEYSTEGSSTNPTVRMTESGIEKAQSISTNFEKFDGMSKEQLMEIKNRMKSVDKTKFATWTPESQKKFTETIKYIDTLLDMN